MKRIALTDGSGGWFDADKATLYKENLVWNGNNHISAATGSQFSHEEIYRTAKGAWVMHEWSQWQGSTDNWFEITATDAAIWLSVNGHTHPEIEGEIAELEI